MPFGCIHILLLLIGLMMDSIVELSVIVILYMIYTSICLEFFQFVELHAKHVISFSTSFFLQLALRVVYIAIGVFIAGWIGKI